MGGEWRELPISEIAEIIGGGTPSTKDEANFNGDIPWITPKDLAGQPYRYISCGERNISLRGLENSSARLLPKGSVLLTTRAPVGYVAIAAVPVTTNQGFRSLVPREGFSPEFIYYLLKSKTEYLKNHASGTTFGELSGTTLKGLRFLFPPLPEQRAIAHILGTLDDKIELNRRMNQTLEAMAQALFKNWFVDFEPFRGQGMQDSPLGKIPVGWEIGTLGDIAHNPRRSVQPNQIENDTAYIGLEHMPRHCITLAEWGKARDIQSNKFEFKQGEILFGKLRPYFHKVGIAPVDGVCSTDILVIVPKEQRWFGIVLCYVFSDEFVKYTDTTSSGTKMPRTNWDDMVRYKIVLPPEDVVKIFNRRIKPFVERIIMNILESRTLASIRDTLLPRLLSGEIRIKDAESFIAGKNRPG